MPISKITRAKGIGSVAQVLSSKSSTTTTTPQKIIPVGRTRKSSKVLVS
jgi:hypothetical protein